MTDPPTIVAIGPFDDLGHAEQLGAAFIAVKRARPTQLGLTVAVRIAAQGCAGQPITAARTECIWSGTVLDTVGRTCLPPPTSSCQAPQRETVLLDLIAAGRAVAASASPVATRLILPARAGLLYWPGDVSAMTAAIVRLLTAPPLRDEVAARARQVAESHGTAMVVAAPSVGMVVVRCPRPGGAGVLGDSQ
jgi:hypothetical protein